MSEGPRRPQRERPDPRAGVVEVYHPQLSAEPLPGIFGPEARSILLSLSDSQKKRYLDPVLKGEKATAFAQTEPDAGADPGGMRTTAVREGDHYRINGYKRYIAHAKSADFLQLVASTDPKKGSRGGLTVFLVDIDTPGVSIAGKTVHMMGDVTYEIALDDVKVPVENRIGNEGLIFAPKSCSFREPEPT